MYSIFRFTLNMRNHRSQATVKVFKGDTLVKLIFNFSDGGNVYAIKSGCKATLTGTKDNGEQLKHDCTIIDNSVVYIFDEETADTSGIVTCEITLYDENGGVITAPKFTIDVDEKEVSGSEPISEYSNAAIATVMGAAAKEYAREQAEEARDMNEKARQESYNTAITTANEAKETAEKALNEVESFDFDYNTTTHELTIKYFKDGAEVAEVLDLNLEAAIIDVDDIIGEDGLPKIRFVFEKGEDGTVINATKYFDLESLITMTNYVQKTDFERFAKILATGIPDQEESEGLLFEKEWDDDGRRFYSVSGVGECKDTEIVIPESHEGEPVTVVFDKIFEGKNNITKVVFPSKIVAVGGLLFEGCNSQVTFDFTKCTKVPMLIESNLYSSTETSSNIVILVSADMVDAFKEDTHFERYAKANCITALTIKGNYIAIEELSKSVSTKADVEFVQSINTKVNMKADASRVEELEAESAILEKRVANLEGATLEFTEDSAVAYRKVVPVNSSKYALVNKVGGISYKTRNLIPFPYSMESASAVGLTATANDDGSIHLSGVATEVGRLNAYFLAKIPVFFPRGMVLSAPNMANSKAETFFWRVMLFDSEGKNLSFQSISSNNITETLETDFVSMSLDVSYFTTEIGEKVDMTFYPMLNEGSTALPFEPYFEGLRDTAVSELSSDGANLIPSTSKLGGVTSRGVNVTLNPDGNSVTLSGTATETENVVAYLYSKAQAIDWPAGTYSSFYNGGKSSGETIYYYIILEDGTQQNVADYAKKAITLTKRAVSIATCLKYAVEAGETVDKTFYFMLNRGSTAAPYKPYRTDAVDTFHISAELRAFLEQYGYGRGVNANWHSYIDFERKVYVHKPTHRQVLDGTENWYARMTVDIETYALYVELDVAGHSYDYGVVGDLICNKYRTQYYDAADEYEVGIGINGSRLSIYDLAYNDGNVDAWKAHLAQAYANGNPLVIEYATGEPNEIDISAYLTDDNFIEVEGGGTITAVNEYEQDAPSTISYVSAIGG